MSLHSPPIDEAERQRLLQTIPRMEDFENNLENIEPLKGGRRSHTLLALSQQSEDEKQCMIDKQQAHFANELKHLDEKDDPLDVYLQHLRWTMEFFPAGNNRESKLTDLLQQASFAFQDDPRYALDARYLKCWLEYAKWVDTKAIFIRLANKGIGQRLALYYEQYSLYYEEQEKYRQARHVLEEGIRRQALPIQRLQQYLEQFDKRIEYKIQLQENSLQTTPTQHQIQSIQRSGERTMLGHKLHSRDTHSMSQSTFNNLQNTSGTNHSNSSNSSSRRSFGNLATATAPIPLSTTAPQQPGPSKFQVFTDLDEESTAKTSSLGRSLQSSSSMDTVFPPTQSTSSASIDRSSSVFSKYRQENTVPVEPFAGAKIPQKSTLVTRPSIPKISVFRDNVSSSSATTNIAHSSSLYSSSLHSPEHVSQTEIDNDYDYTNGTGVRSIDHQTGTPEATQRHDSNNTRHIKSSSSSQLPQDGAVDNKEHIRLLMRRYHNMKNDYIQSHDSAGNPEIVAALTECLGPSGPTRPVSFAELRAARQVNRKGDPQAINAKIPRVKSTAPLPAIIPCRIGQGKEPTKEYTEETLRAMADIGAILSKRREEFDASDDNGTNDCDNDTQMKRMRRTYVNEND